MIVIEDGRKSFTQWDKGIYVLIDEGCDSIDVSRSDKKVSRNVKVQKAGSVFRAAVPDALLTEAGYLNISCIAEEKDGNRTISTYRFRITPRAKPENYAFGHEELGSWKALLMRMNALERAAREGRFDGSQGVGVQAVEPYLTAEMSGFENVYHVILTNGQIFELRIHNGRDGKAGAEGNGIVRIEPVSLSTESGGQSIYRIFYSDGSTFDYTVYNGKDGEKGESIASVTIEKIEEQAESDPFVTKSYVMRIIESDESTVRYNAPQEKTEEERMIAQYNVGILSSVSGVAKTENDDLKINILDGLQIRENAGTVYLLGKKYEFKGEVMTFANSTNDRRTVLFFRLNKTDNSIIGYWKSCKTDVAEIVTISGSETLPVRNDQYFDVVIAYVDIPANATELTADMIHDLRGDPSYCGYVEYTIGGGGSGDMLKSVYDPNGKEKDIFKYADDISKLAVTNHALSDTTHADIRELITGLTNRLNAIADSDDETLDQLSEIVAYIKSNKSLIDAITTMTGATADTDGAAGLVPAPKAGEQNMFLKGDGTWSDITLGKHTDGLIYIFIGGKPVGNGIDISGGSITEPIYGQPTTDAAILSLTQNQSVTLGIKLDAEPNVSQTISVFSNSNLLTFDRAEMIFTASNWNEFQYVTVTAGVFEEDSTVNIVLRNSDELMTDTSIPVYLQADVYSVDMTIPEGQHLTTVDDYTYTLSGNWFIPTKYTGTEANIIIPETIEIDGTVYTTLLSINCFKENTTIQYVEIPDNVKMGSVANYMIIGAFSGCTNLIGLKYRNTNYTNIEGTFSGCTSFKWWDGLELNTGIENMKVAFKDCANLEYVQDISGFEGLTDMSQCFLGSPLVKIYGMPKTVGASCNMNSAFYGTQIACGVIPAGVTNINYCFSGCTNLRTVYVYSDEVTSASGTFTNCSAVEVYAHLGTTTYDTLNTNWGENSEITIKDFSGESLPLIVTWGDSTTSEGTSWGCWPDRLQDKLGISNFVVRNEAVSGEYTTSTSARQGGNTLKILEEFTIPAEATAVTLGSFGTRDGRIFGSSVNNGGSFRPYESFNPCTINGVIGTFTNTNGYQFTRKEAGEAVTVRADTYVYSNQDDSLNNSNVIMLIDLGINSGWEEDGTLSNYTAPPIPDDLIQQMQLMVDHFKEKGGTKYIVAGPSAGKFLEPDEYRATIIDEFEVKAAEQFGANFLNLRKYLVENGMTDNGLTATEEDTARIAKGLVPTSLLHGNNDEDLTHPNEYGANSQMLAFYKKGVELGYWE